MFASMPAEFIDYLRDRVELIRYSPGEVIVRQGDAADAFYLVASGFVKVERTAPGGDIVLAYLGPRRLLRRDGRCSAAASRTATCTALDHVEVVKIAGEDFRADARRGSRDPRRARAGRARTRRT